MSWDYYDYSGPKRTRDGIRLQSARGPVGSTWWGKRWVAALESLCDSGRLSRGKSYARQGQVLSIDIQTGKVHAKVQGSRSTPYQVKIALPLLDTDQWQAIQAALEASPLPLARMLAGEMPPELEAIFQASGQQLFPQRRTDLVTDCSCPDWSDPCKHIAAVYYLLAEQFDGDPFLLLKLRGMDRAALLANLSAASETATAAEAGSTEPLPLDAQAFWQGGIVPDLEPLPADLNPATLLQRLKSPPMWRGQTPFIQAIEPVYPAAAKNARAALEEGTLPPELTPAVRPGAGQAADRTEPGARVMPRGFRTPDAFADVVASGTRTASEPKLKPSASAPKRDPTGRMGVSAVRSKRKAETASAAETILAARRGEIAPEIWREESSKQLENLADLALSMLRSQKAWQEMVNLAHAAGRSNLVVEAMTAMGEADDAFELIAEQLDEFANFPALCRMFAQAGRLDLALALRQAAVARQLDSPALKKWYRQVSGRRPTP